VLKVQVDGQDYAFQYKGTVNDSTTSTSQQANSTGQGVSQSSAQTTSQSSGKYNSKTTSQTTITSPQNNQTSSGQISSSSQAGIAGQSSNTKATASPQTSPNVQTTASQSSSSSINSQQTASAPVPASATTSASSSIAPITSLVYQGGTYNRIPSQMAEQAYIGLFLKYLATTSRVYQESYLLGIFTNPMIPYSLLFTYQYNQQLYHVSTTPT
jgi:hypothetical protein